METTSSVDVLGAVHLSSSIDVVGDVASSVLGNFVGLTSSSPCADGLGAREVMYVGCVPTSDRMNNVVYDGAAYRCSCGLRT